MTALSKMKRQLTAGSDEPAKPAAPSDPAVEDELHGDRRHGT